MTGCINKIELIDLTTSGGVIECDALRLDGNAALSLQIHGIEHLFGHLSIRQTATVLNKPIGQRRLAMIYVSNDGKIANVTQVGHGSSLNVNEGS